MMINLEQKRKTHPSQINWIKSRPFVENSRGTLVHRPRFGSTYHIHKNIHVGISFWCGMGVSSQGDNLTFTDSPSDGLVLCERCEAIAVDNGQMSADDICCRHVHIGRTKAVVTCCKKGE